MTFRVSGDLEVFALIAKRAASRRVLDPGSNGTDKWPTMSTCCGESVSRLKSFEALFKLRASGQMAIPDARSRWNQIRYELRSLTRVRGIEAVLRVNVLAGVAG